MHTYSARTLIINEAWSQTSYFSFKSLFPYLFRDLIQHSLYLGLLTSFGLSPVIDESFAEYILVLSQFWWPVLPPPNRVLVSCHIRLFFITSSVQAAIQIETIYPSRKNFTAPTVVLSVKVIVDPFAPA